MDRAIVNRSICLNRQPMLVKRSDLVKKELKKLSLSRETIVQLTGRDLEKVAGAAWSDDSVCPTTAPSDGRPCH